MLPELQQAGADSGMSENGATHVPILEEAHFPPLHYAQRWGLSTKIVVRWFRDVPGVLKVSGMSGRRVSLRIPVSVAERVYRERSGLV